MKGLTCNQHFPKKNSPSENNHILNDLQYIDLVH